MDATKSELETKEIQNSMFGGEVVSKKRKPACPRFPFRGIGGENEDTPPAEVRENRNHAGEPRTHRMYVRKDLATITITAPDGAHHDGQTLHVLPGHPCGLDAGEYHQLTADVYRVLREQMDRLDLASVPEAKRAEIVTRWQAVVDHAACEGWLG